MQTRFPRTDLHYLLSIGYKVLELWLPGHPLHFNMAAQLTSTIVQACVRTHKRLEVSLLDHRGQVSFKTVAHIRHWMAIESLPSTDPERPSCLIEVSRFQREVSSR